MRVVGDPITLGLAGLDNTPDHPTAVVALDDASAPQDATLVVRWWSRTPAWEPRAGEHTIAPSGTGLWSVAPWPVRDRLFDLQPAPTPGRVLVVEPASGEHGPTSDALRARDVDATSVGRLTAESIAAADIVIHGIGPARPLPGDAFAVLAAGRLLITNADPGFGLSEGIEHLTAEEVHTACDLVEAVLASPDAFTAMRRAGRLAAARHRAAESYGRVIADLTADG